MDEIINKLIEIDEQAKSEIKVAESKKENLDDLIEERLKKEKDKIDCKYTTKLRFKENELKEKLEKEQERINSNLQMELDKLENEYKLDTQVRLGKMMKNMGI